MCACNLNRLRKGFAMAIDTLNFSETTDDVDIRDAVRALGRSQRGQTAMCRLMDFFDDGGLGLDPTNQLAVLTLVEAAFTGRPGSTTEVIRDAFGGNYMPLRERLSRVDEIVGKIGDGLRVTDNVYTQLCDAIHGVES